MRKYKIIVKVSPDFPEETQMEETYSIQDARNVIEITMDTLERELDPYSMGFVSNFSTDLVKGVVVSESHQLFAYPTPEDKEVVFSAKIVLVG